MGDIGKQRATERRPFRRLDHHGVAGRQRRANLPSGQHEGRVPRRDQHGHSRRIVADVVDHLGMIDGVIVEAQRPFSEETDVLRGARHHAMEVAGEQRAIVGGFHCGNLCGTGHDAAGKTAQDRQASSRAQRGPCGESGLGRSHRHVGFRFPACCYRAEVAAVDGGGVGEAMGRRHPAAVNPMVERDLNAGNNGPGICHRDPPQTCPLLPRVDKYDYNHF